MRNPPGYDAAYYRAHKEKKDAFTRKWRDEHRDHVRKYTRNQVKGWREQNRARALIYNREYAREWRVRRRKM
jgi:hypothetical protein